MGEKKTHDGHRIRLRQQISERGLDGLPLYNILEFILFHTIARKDVNDLAHALIERFGSFSGVLDASRDDLKKVSGVSDVTATFLNALPSIFRAYQEDKTAMGVIFEDITQVGDYLSGLFVGRSVETVILICLNLKNKLIASRVVAVGSVGHVALPVRKVVETALSVGAVSVAIAHNHPNGYALPSSGDISATRQLQDALTPLGIELVDHVVVNEDDYTSMRLSGYLKRN